MVKPHKGCFGGLRKAYYGAHISGTLSLMGGLRDLPGGDLLLFGTGHLHVPLFRGLTGNLLLLLSVHCVRVNLHGPRTHARAYRSNKSDRGRRRRTLTLARAKQRRFIYSNDGIQ